MSAAPFGSAGILPISYAYVALMGGEGLRRATEVAAFPVESLRAQKYWPPVRRIDGAYGDRHLVCSCPPPEAFAE